MHAEVTTRYKWSFPKLPRSEGMTLLELLIVLCIIAILASSAGYFFSRQHLNRIIIEQSSRVMSFLIRVQRSSQWHNNSQQITLQQQSNNWLLCAQPLSSSDQPTEQKTLQLSITNNWIDSIEYTSSSPIIFYGQRGMASAGHIQISNGSGQIRVIVSARGRIRRCRVNEASTIGNNLTTTQEIPAC